MSANTIHPEISMSAEALSAIIKHTAEKAAMETLKQFNKATMNVTDYAKYANKSRTTIHKMINRGELKTNRHGEIYINQN